MENDKKNWVEDVVWEWVKISNDSDKNEVEKKDDKKIVKKEETKKKGESIRTVKLFLDWNLWEYNINEKLPAWFLQSKLKENQMYLPVGLYRDIMKQIGEYGIPEFSEPEKFLSGKNKSQVDMVTYKMICTVMWYKPWEKNPIILKWFWYSSMSAWVLLSDAVHWNMHTLAAKSLRDAMKYSYNIFEYPESEVYDTQESWVIAEKKVDNVKAVQTIDNIVNSMPKQEETTSLTEEILKAYTERKTVVIEQLSLIWEEFTKKQVLSIWSELKAKFWDENKEIISKIITPDFNACAR